jgi:hypothetical protein
MVIDGDLPRESFVDLGKREPRNSLIFMIFIIISHTWSITRLAALQKPPRISRAG